MGREELDAPAVREIAAPDRLPVLPLAQTVIFPNVLAPMAIQEPPVTALLSRALETHKQVALLALRPDRSASDGGPGEAPFFDIGTHGSIVQMVKLPDASVRLLVQAGPRFRVREFIREGDGWFVTTEPLPDEDTQGAHVDALQRVVTELFTKIAAASAEGAGDLPEAMTHIQDAAQLADFVAAHLDIDFPRKQELLEQTSVASRLEKLAGILGEEQQVIDYGTELQQKMKEEVGKTQRELWLREQLRIIQQELGEDEEGDVGELRRQMEAAGLSGAPREHTERELRRLERTPPQAAEYQMIRSYLDWIVSLPWSAEREEEIDLSRARSILDRDHYNLEEVKKRIVEYLAVRKLNSELHGPILCFVGPPGVGKTSLGRSIAEAMGREFTRISLGGVRDEAEIRGHRRTYVGALPGRILQGMRRAEVRNPVFMLDEIDKLGNDFRGDPTSALLEVLDPAQNNTFSDHYLEIPFDLSRVTFIATANTLGSVPPALEDRLEILRIPGYTGAEKCQIACRYLIPRQRKETGLGESQISISNGALRQLIEQYTREAGVRELERQIAGVMRKVAVRIVEGEGSDQVRVTRRNLTRLAGKRRFERELAGRENEIGTATALAYTPEGGQILFVEGARMPGGGKIHLTGHLGGVMKESARAALSYLRSRAAELQIPDAQFDKIDLHVHIPGGATPKDGPSAGVALAVALASLFTGRPVRPDVAMTGELTLRGQVLPVGGVKEKLIAASEAGIRTVLVPARNEVDLEEVPAEVQEKVDFVLIERVADALDIALGAPPERIPTAEEQGPRLAAS